MKKPLVLLLIAILGLQVQAQMPISFGPKVGFTSSRLTTDKIEIYEAFKTHFQAGAFARVGLRTYVQPEVNFVVKGGFFNSENTDFEARSINLSTVEIPILLGTKVLDLKVANLRFMLGPSAAFVIDKEIRMASGATLPLDKNRIKDAIWSVQAGVGLDVLMFALDVRYEYGLNDIYDGTGFQLRNSLFNVSVGWKIL